MSSGVRGLPGLRVVGLGFRFVSVALIHRTSVSGLTIVTRSRIPAPSGLANRISRYRSRAVTLTGPSIWARRISFSALRYWICRRSSPWLEPDRTSSSRRYGALGIASVCSGQRLAARPGSGQMVLFSRAASSSDR